MAKPAGAVTSHDIARLAQVSQATVSRVLREDPRVRPATRARVLKVLAETRYEPNAAARGCAGSCSGAAVHLHLRICTVTYASTRNHADTVRKKTMCELSITPLAKSDTLGRSAAWASNPATAGGSEIVPLVRS